MDLSLDKIRGGTYGAHSGGSGRHNQSKKGTANNDSYMMSSFNSQAGKETNVAVNPVRASPDHDIQHGRYLDTQHTRNTSIAESERVLTSTSSDDDIRKGEQWGSPTVPKLGRSLSGDGIRVTREVDVRDESMDARQMQGRRW